MLLDALRPGGDVLQTPPTFLPRRWQFDTFAMVLSDTRFRAWITTSMILAVASTGIVLAVAVPAAYFTARHTFPGRRAFLLLVLVTQLFPPTALVRSLPRVLRVRPRQHLSRHHPHQRRVQLAFGVWILHGFFATIPKEVERAATLDGCNRVRILAKVMLPLTRPGLVTTMIFSFIAT
jgi:multiple sugar transport system permease protein